MSAFAQEKWEAAFQAALSTSIENCEAAELRERRMFLAGISACADVIGSTIEPLGGPDSTASARDDFEVCPVGTLRRLGELEAFVGTVEVASGIPVEHPEYCHEHGNHLRGSPACDRALARARAVQK